MDEAVLLEKAQSGDIRAFHTLFSEFHPQLKSYLYRLVANRDDMEDLAHDVFILAFENVPKFKGESSLKTWVFAIATNRARKHLKDQNRWTTDTLERTKVLAHSNPEVMHSLDYASNYAPHRIYEIREHIDYCFTCTSKMLVIEQQLALILKDVYSFKVKEVAVILDKTYGVTKHLIYDARHTMMRIFDDTCAFVSRQGVCNQCSELNGRFNPKQDRRVEEMKIKMVRDRDKYDRTELYKLRTELVRSIDPLHANGTDLHETFLRINHRVNAIPPADT
jgi:RNA polymerase sigma-70 factor (ECF subfamily)